MSRSKFFMGVAAIALCLVAVIISGVSPQTADPTIDWANLRNPILWEPDRLLKDPSVVYHDGWFYIFTHQNYRTRNLKDYEFLGDTGSQPDVTWDGSKWIMAKNGGRLPGWTQ